MRPSPFVLFALVIACGIANASVEKPRDRYFLINLPAREISDDTFRAIKQLQSVQEVGAPRLGIGIIVSYLRQPREKNVALLRRTLQLCRQHQLAVIVQLDGEQWWQNRPDLWNWWDKSRPGYDPANASNVEWSGWGPEHALKIAWRNWGKQVRVLPPPNLMSPRYREACHEEVRALLKEIIQWQASLSAEEKWLLVGVKVGWESAIGMGSHYYPNGNALVGADPSNDPQQKARADELPGRGFQPIGYAAVSTAGLARDGALKEADLAEVIRRHLADLAKVARDAGLPRNQIFTHCGGWAEGEQLYRSALNEDSCPGWSFYRHGRDPLGDKTAMAALKASDAPYWAAVEWLPVGARNADDWRAAIVKTLGIPRCRYVCAFNWGHIRESDDAQQGIRRALSEMLGGEAPAEH